MLPILTFRQATSSGETSIGLVEDVSTRVLQTVRVGEGAGKLSSGGGNAFVGYEAGKKNTKGSFATYIGYRAGAENTSASYGTYVGAYAGRQNKQGAENVFVGFRSGEQNLGGSDCVAVGAYSMRNNASGNYSVAVGFAAGERCLDGSFNTMVGAEAGQDNRSGSFNTMTGYRSGRSAFQGSYNTYFGAYAGYSNNNGNANCFIGFKSGESLRQGDLNIAVGAFAMAHAEYGSSNIAIGPYTGLLNKGSGNVIVGLQAGASNHFGDNNVVLGTNAGISNQGDENVIIGYNSASHWSGDKNVLIGTNICQDGSGSMSVFIGYNTANSIYRGGSCNLFIGTGADSITSTVDNAICIGTRSTKTASDTITIGDTIQNVGYKSINMGFQIQSDAIYSVLVGNELIITSAIYFKDPLNFNYLTTVKKDALDKFGISNISFNDEFPVTIYYNSNEIYPNAVFGYITSNTFNTTTNPYANAISPSSYDIVSFLPVSSLYYGSNFFITSDSDLAYNYTNVNVNNVIHENLNLKGTSIASYQNVPTFSNEGCLMNETWKPEVAYVNNVVANITAFDVSANVIPIHFAKRAKVPTLSFVNDSNTYTQNMRTILPINIGESLSNSISFTEGVTIPFSKTVYANNNPNEPTYGMLSQSSWSNISDIIYSPHLEATFSTVDAFSIYPITQIQDDNSNLFGVASNETHDVIINKRYKSKFVVNSITWPGSENYNVDSNFIYVSSGLDLASSTKLRFENLDSNVLLSYNGSAHYTSNEVKLMVERKIDNYLDGPIAREASFSPTRNALSLIHGLNQTFLGTIVVYIINLRTNLSTWNPNGSSFAEISDMLDYIDNIENLIFELQTSSTWVNHENIGLWWDSYKALHVLFFDNEVRRSLDSVTLANIESAQETFENAFFGSQRNAFFRQFTIFKSNVTNQPSSTNPLNFINDSYELYTITQSNGTFANDDTRSLTFVLWNAYKEWYTAYFLTRRLFLTYDDVLSQKIALSNIAPLVGTYQPIQLRVEDSLFEIKVIVPRQLASLWEANYTTASSTLFTSNFNGLACENISYSNAFIRTYPHSGSLLNIRGEVSTSLRDFTYRPYNIWTSEEERIEFLLRNEKMETKSIYWNISKYVSPSSQPFSYIHYPTSNVVTSVANVLLNVTTSNVTMYHSSTTTCNVYINNTLTQTYNTSVAYFPVSAYSSMDGLRQETSNQTLSYTINVSQASGKNVTTYRNLFTLQDYDINGALIIASSFVNRVDSTNVIEGSENVQPSSNVLIDHLTTLSRRRRRPLNQSYSIILNDINDFTHRAINITDRPTIYKNIVATPRAPSQSNLMQMTLNEGSSSILFSYSNFNVLSNIDQYDSYLPIQKTYIFEPATLISWSETNYFQTMRLNFGPVQSFHNSNIENKEIYLRSQLPYTSSSITFSKSTLSYNANGTLKTVEAEIIPKQYIIDNAWIVNTPIEYQLELDHEYKVNILPFIAALRSNLSFIPTHLHISQVVNGCVISSDRIVNIVDLSQLNSASFFYQASKRYHRDELQLYFTRNVGNDKVASSVKTVSVVLKVLPLQDAFLLTSGLVKRYPITSNVLYQTNFDYPFSSIQFQFTDTNKYRYFLDNEEFTPSAVRLVTSDEISSKNFEIVKKIRSRLDENLLIPYSINAGGQGISTESFYLSCQHLYHNDFPQQQDLIGSSDFVIQSLGTLPTSNILKGPLFQLLETLTDGGRPINLDLETDDMTLSFGALGLEKGFLSHSSIVSNTKFNTVSWSNIMNNMLAYIPYTPMSLSNETIKMFIGFNGFTSPEYEIKLKNYWWRPSAIPVFAGRQTVEGRRIVLPLHLRSHGMIEDNVIITPNEFDVSYHSNVLHSAFSHPSIIINDIEVPINYTQMVSSLPPLFKTTNIGIVIDESDAFSLKALVADTVVSFDNKASDNLILYLGKRPVNGVIKRTNLQSTSDEARWTFSNLINNDLHYQHLGGNTLADEFTFRYSSTPYDVSIEQITVSISVRKLPRLTKNTADTIFHTTSNNALSTIHSLKRTIQLDDINANLHVISSENVVLTYGIGNVFPYSQADVLSQGYKIAPLYFENPENTEAPYLDFSLQFCVNNFTDYHVHHLSTYEIYNELFVYSWDSKLNYFQSLNDVVVSAPYIENQELTYDFDVNSVQYIDFENRELNVAFEFQPTTPLFDGDIIQTEGRLLAHLYEAFSFEISFLDTLNQVPLRVKFENSRLVILSYEVESVVFFTYAVKDSVLFNKWNKIMIVCNDSSYDNLLSIYVDFDPFSSLADNQSKNILRLLNIQKSILLQSLKRIVVSSDAQNNFVADIDQVISSERPGDHLNATIQATNLAINLQFRNLEIYSSTNASSSLVGAGNETYNVVLGRQLQVKGINNVCIGTNFSTTGKNSIILGNDIGKQSTNDLNQIYESIIIGNTSFQNSLARDIICIGTGNMNQLVPNVALGITSDQIDQFLSKRPIIIGNDIGPEKADYHVNLANTVLRTSIRSQQQGEISQLLNTDQIYIGLDGEYVGIGFESNASLSGSSIFQVNGEIYAKSIRTDSFTFLSEITLSQASLESLTTSNLTTFYVHASNIFTTSFIASNIDAQTIHTSSLVVDDPISHLFVESLGTCNVSLSTLSLSNVRITGSMYIEPTAVGNIITPDGLSATVYQRFHHVQILTAEANEIVIQENGYHYVDESDVEVFLNGIKLSYFTNDQQHYKVGFVQDLVNVTTTFTITLNETAYENDLLDIKIHPKLVSLYGNSTDLFILNDNMLLLKGASDMYIENATFCNVRVLGQHMIDPFNVRTPYQVESVHEVFILPSVHRVLEMTKAGYFEASPLDSHIYQNGMKLTYIDDLTKDFDLSFLFDTDKNETKFTITFEEDIEPFDVVDVTIFPKQTRDDFGYLYQNFSINTTWNETGSNLHLIGCNVGLNTSEPQSTLHVVGNVIIDGELSHYRHPYGTNGLFGSESLPISGGNLVIDLIVHANVIIELDSTVDILNISFTNLIQGQRGDIVIIDRCLSGRDITIDSRVRFSATRPLQTSPLLDQTYIVDVLSYNVIKNDLILGSYSRYT